MDFTDKVIYAKKSGGGKKRLSHFGLRFDSTRRERDRQGTLLVLKLSPLVHKNVKRYHSDFDDIVKSFKLPTGSMTMEDQRLIIRLYALADGRCPIEGCEPLKLLALCTPLLLSTAGYQIVSSTGAVRDAKEYLTGVGIYKACCADNQDSSVIVRPNERIVPHWLTFHMRL